MVILVLDALFISMYAEEGSHFNLNSSLQWLAGLFFFKSISQ